MRKLSQPTPLSGGTEGRASAHTTRASARPSGPPLNGVWAVLLFSLLAAAPAPRPADPQLWAELQQVDAAAGRAAAVTADFRQEKFTPLLRRPLLSTGHVAARGPTALWTTLTPRPLVMRVTAAEIRIYYPDQAVVEIYPVQGQLGALAASPLPRLDVLKQLFTFDRLPTPDPDVLNVKLTPVTAELQQHVREVRVSLDRRTGAIRRAETTDADGDRAVLTFDHANLHAAASDADLTFQVPPGTREVYPLAGVTPTTGP